MAAWEGNVEVLKGRAITSLFTVIRDKDASTADYITHADRLLNLLAEETLAQHATPHTVTTPCGTYEGLKPCPATELCAVSIVRSGDILLEATRRACLGIAVGKILIQRDEETALPKLFYSKLPPDVAQRKVILVDPMLATGGSAITAIQVLLDAGVPEEHILFSNVVSYPEGLAAMFEAHPKVRTVTCAVDDGLNDKKYIVPGLGDFGDRYYST